jgi:hypothetical protein
MIVLSANTSPAGKMMQEIAIAIYVSMKITGITIASRKDHAVLTSRNSTTTGPMKGQGNLTGPITIEMLTTTITAAGILTKVTTTATEPRNGGRMAAATEETITEAETMAVAR